MRTRLLVAGAFLALFALAAPAAAGGGGHGICDGFTTGNEIVVRDSCFQGAAHFAEAGATVRVVNQGFATHDVTAVDGTFASGPLEPGATFDLVVDERGAIPYYCTLHGTPQGQGMAGVLIVGNGDATARRAHRPGARSGGAGDRSAGDRHRERCRRLPRSRRARGRRARAGGGARTPTEKA